jgi:hypothetical protein
MSEYLMKPTLTPTPQGITETVTNSDRESLNHVPSCSIPNARYLQKGNETVKNQISQPTSASGASNMHQASSSSDYRNSAVLPTGHSSASRQTLNRETLMVHESSINRNARRNDTSDNNVFKDSYCKAPKLFETNETAIMSGAVGTLTATGIGKNNDNIGYFGEDPTVDLLAILGMQRVPTPNFLYVPPKPRGDEDPADYEALKRQREALERHPRFTPTIELQMEMKQYKKELKM